jgi:hypothetical protein
MYRLIYFSMFLAVLSLAILLYREWRRQDVRAFFVWGSPYLILVVAYWSVQVGYQDLTDRLQAKAELHADLNQKAVRLLIETEHELDVCYSDSPYTVGPSDDPLSNPDGIPDSSVEQPSVFARDAQEPRRGAVG